MATKAEIDAKWEPLHKRVSAAYLALPLEKRKHGSVVWLLMRKFHLWLSASRELEYVTNGVIPDEVIMGEDKQGKEIKVPASPMLQKALVFSPTLQERVILADELMVII